MAMATRKRTAHGFVEVQRSGCTGSDARGRWFNGLSVIVEGTEVQTNGLTWAAV